MDENRTRPNNDELNQFAGRVHQILDEHNGEDLNKVFNILIPYCGEYNTGIKFYVNGQEYKVIGPNYEYINDKNILYMKIEIEKHL